MASLLLWVSDAQLDYTATEPVEEKAQSQPSSNEHVYGRCVKVMVVIVMVMMMVVVVTTMLIMIMVITDGIVVMVMVTIMSMMMVITDGGGDGIIRH